MCSECPRQIKKEEHPRNRVQQSFVLMHKGKQINTYIQMFSKMIPASNAKINHNMVRKLLEEILNKPMTEYINEKTTKGLFSPFVIHPAWS